MFSQGHIGKTVFSRGHTGKNVFSRGHTGKICFLGVLGSQWRNFNAVARCQESIGHRSETLDNKIIELLF